MPDPAWRCRQPIAEVLLAWEGEQHAVYFDPESGDTHLIAALGAQLAEWLAAGPLDRDQLLARLTQQQVPVGQAQSGRDRGLQQHADQQRPAAFAVMRAHGEDSASVSKCATASSSRLYSKR